MAGTGCICGGSDRRTGERRPRACGLRKRGSRPQARGPQTRSPRPQPSGSGGGCRRALHRDEHGQVAVEFAIVLPVVIMLMVVVIDCMVYIGEAARFDHVVPQRILEIASSPARELYGDDERLAAVTDALNEEFSQVNQSVSVELESAVTTFAGMSVYRCTLRISPWPFSAGGSTLFGMGIPLYLEHEYAFAFDPYTPGKIW